MKFFATHNVRKLNQYTIENEPIASIDLMERAADALYWEFLGNFPYHQPVLIFVGPGNNGGDALALARILLKSGFETSVFLVHTGSLSIDCETNRKRLLENFPDSLTELKDNFIPPEISGDTLIIDGLFGSGLSRPLNGIFAETVNWINQSGCTVVSIDIPSGLNGEEIPLTPKGEQEHLEFQIFPDLPIVKADYTFSLQFPKLAFFFPENASFVGNWSVVDIGIHPEAIKQTSSNFNILEEKEVSVLLKKRPKFSHKGTFGHALIIAGSNGMAGSAVLSSKAALRSGAGLVSVHSADCNRTILQTAVPEVIFKSDSGNDFISKIDDVENYNAVAIGSGIGTRTETVEMLGNFLKKLNVPCVLDADALNIIGKHKEMLKLIPKNSILTPHPKEFERMFGVSNNSYDRMIKAQQMAKNYGIIIVLKGAHTLISMPDGKLFFNSTGNSGMATAGSGDVLTGIITGLLAQGYKPEEAAKLGVFIHGRAGDLALKNESKESLIARDIIASLGKAFNSLKD